MNKKLLFFDIDGTLLAGGIPGYIPDSAIESLKQAQANGHYLFINSGRTYSFMPDVIKNFPFDGYICGCGTEVIFQGETLYHHQLPAEIRFGLRKILKKMNIQAAYEGHYSCFFDEHEELLPPLAEIRDIYANNGSPSAVGSFDDENLDFDKFVIFTDSRSDVDGFFRIVSEDFQRTQWENTKPYGFAEFVPKSCSKATGIDFIIRHLNCSLDDCYVFGDGTNDLPMLTHVKNSVAMGNSSPEILGKTSYVTTPVYRDGIKLAMQHFHLI